MTPLLSFTLASRISFGFTIYTFEKQTRKLSAGITMIICL